MKSPFHDHRERLVFSVLAMVIFLTIGISHWSEIGSHTLATRSMRNALHAPAFSLFSLVLFIASLRGRSTGRALVLTLLVVVPAAFFGEIIQLFGPGESSIVDLGKNFIGILAGLLIAVFITGAIRENFSWLSRLVVLAVTIASGAAVMLPVYKAAELMVYRAQDSGSLFVPGESMLAPYFQPQYGARIAFSSPPEVWPEPASLVGLVTFSRQEYSGISFEPPRNWTDFSSLQLTVASAADQDVALSLSILDEHYEDGYDDRFNFHFTVTDQPLVLRIPLKDIVNQPKHRTIDLNSMTGVYLFQDAPTGGEAIILGRVLLTN